MSYLIILRGPMGSGKTVVAQYLRGELEDSDTLDLDVNANDPIENLDKVLRKKNVVAELYYGNSHTTDPKWIKEFQARGFTILSVVLKARLETHIERLAKRPNKRGRNDVEHHYKKFHNELKPKFRALAGIDEISIDTDEKEIKQIGDEILGYLNKGAAAPSKII
jgi:shikimate kinase